MFGEVGAEPAGMRQMLGEADYADAETDARGREFSRFREEAVVRRLPRVVGAPERDGFRIGFGEPVGAAAEVGLDGHAFDMRLVGQVDQGAPIPGADEALTPRGEEDRQPVAGLPPGPGGEAVEGVAVGAQLSGRVPALGERAIRAVIVAGGQRAAIQQGQIHGRYRSS
ncbi:hypothetical protein Ntsu_67290 [Nocardia sp. IFM 10818]